MRSVKLPYDGRYEALARASMRPTDFAATSSLAFAGLAVSAQSPVIHPGNAMRPYDRTAITSVSSAEQARLTAAERDAGWKLLFDGTTTNGWRGFKKPGFPAKGWSIDAGRLKHAATGGSLTADSGDIITIDTFNDFDLRFEWIVAPGANSGIKYLVTEDARRSDRARIPDHRRRETSGCADWPAPRDGRVV